MNRFAVRKLGDPGYLGPAQEAQREREMVRAAAASPVRRPRPQADVSTLGLFASSEGMLL